MWQEKLLQLQIKTFNILKFDIYPLKMIVGINMQLLSAIIGAIYYLKNMTNVSFCSFDKKRKVYSTMNIKSRFRLALCFTDGEAVSLMDINTALLSKSLQRSATTSH